MEDPDKNDKTKEEFANLYEHWKARYPDPALNGEPYVATPKSGSDFQGFYTMFGIPVTDVRYEYDKVCSLLIFDNQEIYMNMSCFSDVQTVCDHSIFSEIMRPPVLCVLA